MKYVYVQKLDEYLAQFEYEETEGIIEVRDDSIEIEKITVPFYCYVCPDDMGYWGVAWDGTDRAECNIYEFEPCVRVTVHEGISLIELQDAMDFIKIRETINGTNKS